MSQQRMRRGRHARAAWIGTILLGAISCTGGGVARQGNGALMPAPNSRVVVQSLTSCGTYETTTNAEGRFAFAGTKPDGSVDRETFVPAGDVLVSVTEPGGALTSYVYHHLFDTTCGPAGACSKDLLMLTPLYDPASSNAPGADTRIRFPATADEVAGFVEQWTATCTTEVEVRGSITDYVFPILHAAGSDLTLCLLAGGERHCGPVERSEGDDYRSVVALPKTLDPEALTGAELTYRGPEKWGSCVIAPDRSTTCDRQRVTLTYAQPVTGVEAEVDWDLGDAHEQETSTVGLAQKLPAKAASASSYACLPQFTSQPPWLAADGGFSIPLGNGTSLYVFGDTVVGTPTQLETFVGNTIAISRCEGGVRTMRYLWRREGTSHQAFFASADPGQRFWPRDMFMSNGSLYVTLAVVEPSSGGLGFSVVGTKLARIDDPGATEPEDWQITYVDLTPNTDLMPDHGLTLDGSFVKFNSAHTEPGGKIALTVTRLPTAALGAPSNQFEYLGVDGAWRPWTTPAPLAGPSRPVAVPVANQPEYHPGLGKWVVFSGEPFSQGIEVRTADAFEGPWSEPRWVYVFPEIIEQALAVPPQNVICYAVREHPELRQENGRVLVLTYACNTLGSGPVPFLQNLPIYLPKTLTVDLRDLGLMN
jgi:hypothetical protein